VLLEDKHFFYEICVIDEICVLMQKPEVGERSMLPGGLLQEAEPLRSGLETEES
jgi:hypothetical protein